MYTIEEHENRINDLISALNIEGVDQAKVSLLIQELRTNYNDVNTKVSESTKAIEDYTTLNEGLRSANMKLLSQLGSFNNDFEKRDKLEIIKGKEQKPNEEEPKEDVLSLDDIAKSF